MCYIHALIKMVVLAVAVVVTLSSCAVGCSHGSNATDLKLWSTENQPTSVQLAAVIKELQTLRCEQTTLQHQTRSHEERNHAEVGQSAKSPSPHKTQEGKTFVFGRTTTFSCEAGTHVLTYGPSDDEEDLESSEEESSRRRGDPCFHYTVLDQAWRASNTTTKFKMCDRQVKWKGWYRLFYKGKSIQMPERCVPVEKCGTNAPLWLAGPHPRRRDGVVSRNVCGHWKKRCCAFRSTPIKVKKCRGNYYVYKFSQPSACYLAYCADINTLVCGRCRRNQTCVSRDKINWRCKRKRRFLSRKVHFFASYPGQLTGKVNRIKYSKVLVNVGRGFRRSAGVFKAPVKGIYQFFFSTQTADAGLKTELWLVISGYWVSVSHTRVARPSTVGALSTYMTFLRRGAVVYVTHNSGRSWANAASSTITFGGSLLVQMR